MPQTNKGKTKPETNIQDKAELNITKYLCNKVITKIN